MYKRTTAHRAGASRGMRGITLLELMIVLVIVGILASIGYPAYVDYSNRARRADGKSLLMDAAARMERYYFDNNSYTTTLTANGLGYANGSAAPCNGVICSGEQNYTLAAASCPSPGTIATCYVLTASPNASKPFNDPDCGNLTLDNRGQRGVSGTDSVDDCWGR